MASPHVAGAAAPFEVLVSRTVRDLVAGAGLTFHPHPQSVDDGAGQPLPLFIVDTGHLANALMSY